MIDTTPDSPAPARQRWWIALCVLLLLAALAAWGAWHLWQTQLEQARQLDQRTALELQGLRETLDSLRRDQRATSSRVQDAASTNRVLRDEVLGLGQRSALLEENVARLAQRGTDSVQALRVEEAEFLLSQAQQRMALAGDVEGARRLYALAAGIIDQLDAPEYINLRQALIQERNAVDALGAGARVDVAAKLDAWSKAVLRPDVAVFDAKGADARGAGEVVQPWWQRMLAPLVTIRPTQGPVLVARSERVAAMDSLQTELTLAHAAIERGDTAAFERALTRVDMWLGRLWPDSPALRERRGELAALGRMPLQADPPELGSTLQQLRAMRTGAP